MKINPTQHLTTLVTGHGNIKSYLHRFRITEAPDCPRGNGNQTAEHILRNTTWRKRTPNSSSSEDRQLAHRKRYAYQNTQQSIRRIRENDGQNKRTQHTVKKVLMCGTYGYHRVLGCLT